MSAERHRKHRDTVPTVAARALTRRSVLRSVGGVAALGVVASCGQDDGSQSTPNLSTSSSSASSSARSTTVTPSPPTSTTGAEPAVPASSVLLAFYSRAGENYYYGDRRNLKVGNTEVLASMIADRIGCDVFEIKPADPYSDDYDATVARNVEEENDDARPAIVGELPDLTGYATVLLASPIWNVQTPMIMRTFAEALDFTGITIHPVATYAVSQIGSAPDDYRRACAGATIGDSLAILGEAVTDGDDSVGSDLDEWLGRVGLR